MTFFDFQNTWFWFWISKFQNPLVWRKKNFIFQNLIFFLESSSKIDIIIIRKINIYGKAAKEVNADFIPLAVETYGRWGNQALQYSRERLKEFANNLEFEGQADRGLLNKLQRYWWSSLSCCLQKGNVAIINRRYFRALEMKYGKRFLMKKFSVKLILDRTSTV